MATTDDTPENLELAKAVQQALIDKEGYDVTKSNTDFLQRFKVDLIEKQAGAEMRDHPIRTAFLQTIGLHFGEMHAYNNLTPDQVNTALVQRFKELQNDKDPQHPLATLPGGTSTEEQLNAYAAKYDRAGFESDDQRNAAIKFIADHDRDTPEGQALAGNLSPTGFATYAKDKGIDVDEKDPRSVNEAVVTLFKSTDNKLTGKEIGTGGLDNTNPVIDNSTRAELNARMNLPDYRDIAYPAQDQELPPELKGNPKYADVAAKFAVFARAENIHKNTPENGPDTDVNKQLSVDADKALRASLKAAGVADADADKIVAQVYVESKDKTLQLAEVKGSNGGTLIAMLEDIAKGVGTDTKTVANGVEPAPGEKGTDGKPVTAEVKGDKAPQKTTGEDFAREKRDGIEALKTLGYIDTDKPTDQAYHDAVTKFQKEYNNQSHEHKLSVDGKIGIDNGKNGRGTLNALEQVLEERKNTYEAHPEVAASYKGKDTTLVALEGQIHDAVKGISAALVSYNAGQQNGDPSAPHGPNANPKGPKELS